MSSSLLSLDDTRERLDERHSSGYWRYLDSPPFVDACLKRIGLEVSWISERSEDWQGVLDVGCGTGKLAQYCSPPYDGIDASEEAVKVARANCSSGRFSIGRLEKPSQELNQYSIIVFGNVLEIYVAPDKRVELLTLYRKLCNPTHFIIYDLERLKDDDLRKHFNLVSEHHARVNLAGLPDSKRGRKILVLEA